jgi:hypothetical protein
MRRSFPSRKGPIVGLIYLGLICLLFFLMGLPAIRSGNLILLSIWLFIQGVFVITWFGIGYIIEEGNLMVKIGPLIERTIPIGEISTIHRSYELQSSSSGPSLKKLKVRFKGGHALITPGREGEFLAELKAVNPQIFIDLETATML